MLLTNLSLINQADPVHIRIRRGTIISVENGTPDSVSTEEQIRFPDALAVPGFINSHDHLDFNCYRTLGNKIYSNYREWGKDIHLTRKEEILAVQKIPKNLRIYWGMYKNLLCGVTTVVPHGAPFNIENPLIDIHQDLQNIHSTGFEKNWKMKLNNPFHTNKPVVIHAGEGKDAESKKEMDKLIHFNFLKRKMIAVHGVAMDSVQARQFEGLIWCPESNHELLRAQPEINSLKRNTTLVFGTDSTLTGNWNYLHHLRFARALGILNDEELFGITTSSPARLWNLNSGKIRTGCRADLLIFRRKKNTSIWDNLFNTDPQDILMVISKGNIRLFDQSILTGVLSTGIDLSKFSRIFFQGSEKYVEGDLPALKNAIQRIHPDVEFPFTTRSTSKFPENA